MDNRERALDQVKIGGDPLTGVVFALVYIGEQLSQQTAEFEVSIRDLSHEITELDTHLVDAMFESRGETNPNPKE
jgi:hypothetical protein